MLDNAPDFTVEKLTFYEREKDHCRRLRAEHGVACLALLVSTQLYNDPEDPLPDDLITSHTRRLDETLEKVRKIHRADGVIRVRFFLLSFFFFKKIEASFFSAGSLLFSFFSSMHLHRALLYRCQTISATRLSPPRNPLLFSWTGAPFSLLTFKNTCDERWSRCLPTISPMILLSLMVKGDSSSTPWRMASQTSAPA